MLVVPIKKRERAFLGPKTNEVGQWHMAACNKESHKEWDTLWRCSDQRAFKKWGI